MFKKTYSLANLLFTIATTALINDENTIIKYAVSLINNL
jgi:hypothetical protein